MSSRVEITKLLHRGHSAAIKGTTNQINFQVIASITTLSPVVISSNINYIFMNALSEHLIKCQGCHLISGRKYEYKVLQFKYNCCIDSSDAHCFIISSCEIHYTASDAPLRILLTQDVASHWGCHIKKFAIRTNVRQMSQVDLGFIYFSFCQIVTSIKVTFMRMLIQFKTK